VCANRRSCEHWSGPTAADRELGAVGEDLTKQIDPDFRLDRQLFEFS
jgi:hypothetical protein